MCDKCREESDDDYEGDSIEQKRVKSTRSVIRRHPELGLDPEEVSVRFGPKAEESGVRVRESGTRPRFEIHIPSYTAQVMSDTPPLREIALAAWIKTDTSFEDLCSHLDIHPNLRFGAVFVSDAPPIRASRAEDAHHVIEYEEGSRDWDDE
jgi:hypothetical protein